MRKKYILLDLDGTLTDSSEGITKSVQYALEKMGITENDMAVLKRYIGPPLNESFTRFHGLSDEDSLKAVAYYRERYADTGLYENKLFDGIKEFLAGLKKEGYIVALATCKPEIYVPTILKHFDIEQYFDVAVGSELEGGKRRHKDDVIEEVISQIIKLKDIPATDIYDVKADAIMIGDRKDDVLGAKDAGIESIGLRYGFAESDELENAGADYILENVEDILPFLNQMSYFPMK